jgi:predicted alpha/beta hydrolase family esterase
MATLKGEEVAIEKFKKRNPWQNFLQEELKENFEVFTPRMPDRENAHYQEWKIWFEKMFPFINDNVVLVGYSLGGIFLAKYLSENMFPKKIKGIILVATPFSDKSLEESLGDFSIGVSLENFSNQVDEIYLIFSKDDPVVTFSHLKKYKNRLPNAEALIFENKGHFYQESFPEIVELIKSLQY